MALRETLVITDGPTEVKSLECCAGRWREASGVARREAVQWGEWVTAFIGVSTEKLCQAGKQLRTVEFGSFQ